MSWCPDFEFRGTYIYRDPEGGREAGVHLDVPGELVVLVDHELVQVGVAQLGHKHPLPGGRRVRRVALRHAEELHDVLVPNGRTIRGD